MVVARGGQLLRQRLLADARGNTACPITVSAPGVFASTPLHPSSSLGLGRTPRTRDDAPIEPRGAAREPRDSTRRPAPSLWIRASTTREEDACSPRRRRRRTVLVRGVLVRGVPGRGPRASRDGTVRRVRVRDGVEIDTPGIVRVLVRTRVRTHAVVSFASVHDAVTRGSAVARSAPNACQRPPSETTTARARTVDVQIVVTELREPSCLAVDRKISRPRTRKGPW